VRLRISDINFIRGAITMSEFKINDYILEQEAKEIIAQGIIEEKEYGVPALEYAQQACDGHQWVIYTYKAMLLCAECDTSAGEEYLEDCGREFELIRRACYQISLCDTLKRLQ
jgi:hypothetical protein